MSRPITVTLGELHSATLRIDQIRAWRVQPQAWVAGQTLTATQVWLEGLDVPFTIDGDHHEALVRAVQGEP